MFRKKKDLCHSLIPNRMNLDQDVVSALEASRCPFPTPEIISSTNFAYICPPYKWNKKYSFFMSGFLCSTLCLQHLHMLLHIFIVCELPLIYLLVIYHFHISRIHFLLQGWVCFSVKGWRVNTSDFVGSKTLMSVTAMRKQPYAMCKGVDCVAVKLYSIYKQVMGWICTLAIVC